MIFFTVGTEKFPFERLVRAAEQTAAQLKGESVFVQLGHSTRIPRGCGCAAFLSYSDMMNRMAEARIVVMHAGAGSILSCLRLGKIPIVLPRRKRWGEHVDDHQLGLAERMAERGQVLLAETPDQVLSLLASYDPSRLAAPVAASSSGLANALSQYLKGPGVLVRDLDFVHGGAR